MTRGGGSASVTAVGGTVMVSSVRAGIDVVAIEAVRHSERCFGDRYLHRVFTSHELEASAGAPDVRHASLAARFAAKEAALKVLDARDDPLDWRWLEVRTDSGAPELALTGPARGWARRAGVAHTSVSLSHDAGVAMAVVVALVDDVPGADEKDEVQG